jgi:hypothetical protein
MSSGLSVGFMLDRQWHWLRGEMETTKKPTLLALGRLFAETQTPYAIIGGIALQVHSSDPRTTIDIDLAVLSREAIPREAMTAAGFRMVHATEWMSWDGVRVTLTDASRFADTIVSADDLVLEDVTLRVMAVTELLRARPSREIRSRPCPSPRRRPGRAAR